MARDDALWAKIRADFLATGKSYPALAKEYGVNLSSVKRVAAQEKWMDARNALNARVAEARRTNRTEPLKTEPVQREPITELLTVPTDQEIMDAKRERLEKFFQITDGMMDRILEAINSPEVISSSAIKNLASALRDLREMQGLNRTELDEEEQRARIEKLRSETRVVEEDGKDSVSIEFVDTYGAEE